MTTQSNLEIVGSIYAAFGRGDIPAIMERVHPDVSWEQGANNYGIPWLTPGSGRAHVSEFFRTLGEFKFERFEVQKLLAADDTVVALLSARFVRPSGQSVDESCEGHVWRLDAQGRVVAFRHLCDSHQHFLAAQPAR